MTHVVAVVTHVPSLALTHVLVPGLVTSGVGGTRVTSGTRGNALTSGHYTVFQLRAQI